MSMVMIMMMMMIMMMVSVSRNGVRFKNRASKSGRDLPSTLLDNL